MFNMIVTFPETYGLQKSLVITYKTDRGQKHNTAIRSLNAKPGNLSLVPRTHTTKEENQLLVLF